MASVFTFDPDVPRVYSPWTAKRSRDQTPESSVKTDETISAETSNSELLKDAGITKLDPEPQDGPTEYKLHLLLRPRRVFSYLSTDTGANVSNVYDNSLELGQRRVQQSTYQSRQSRLEHLTTQLLWRLQQSSPFHSSARRNLVIPTLPDTTTKLDLPNELAPLLPGLEESQGALYEIGVADDGTFVGLTEDEMLESLTNLRAMAASLGCKVEILREVAVGRCNWEEQVDGTDETHVKRISEKLWVVEALVSPNIVVDAKEHTSEQEEVPDKAGHTTHASYLHVALAGPSGAGKSSLLGTLSTSSLDNGRGKSRLSLLRHRHEIVTGMTSSVAQELIGYNPSTDDADDVVNYASGNVSSWNDIHTSGQGGRLAFISDLPGSLRFLKSSLRGVMGWKPQYAFLCVPANATEKATAGDDTSDIELSLWYLNLFYKLKIPTVVLVTKLDTATRTSIRQTLSILLSAIKGMNRKPIMLPAEAKKEAYGFHKITAGDKNEISAAIAELETGPFNKVPILLTSSVMGLGITRLHTLLRLLPDVKRKVSIEEGTNRESNLSRGLAQVFDVLEVFEIPSFKVFASPEGKRQSNERAVILCGRMRRGTISVGETLVIGPITTEGQDKHTPKKAFSIGKHDQGTHGKPHAEWQTQWLPVRIVSARNLRLPAKALHHDQIGTIGIEPLGPVHLLSRIRKGMILADQDELDADGTLAKLGVKTPGCHVGFAASFPIENVQEYLSTNLATGANVVVYINNVRAAARISAFNLRHNNKDHDSHGIGDDYQTTQDLPGDSNSNATLIFDFISAAESIEIGSTVLVMPGVIASSIPSSSGRAHGSHFPVFVGQVTSTLPG